VRDVRAGSLFVDDMQFQSYPQLAQARQLLTGAGAEAIRGVPFVYLFIGYDGNYYPLLFRLGKADPSSRDKLIAELTANSQEVKNALDVINNISDRSPAERPRGRSPRRLIPVTAD
jgi:hypothetical protein